MEILELFIEFYQLFTGNKKLIWKTLKAYSGDLKHFFEYENNILQPYICAFISYLNGQLKHKDTSIRRKIITLKNFYNYLLDNEIIEFSHFRKLKFRFKQERKLPKTSTVMEISKILKCFDANISSLFIYTERIRPWYSSFSAQFYLFLYRYFACFLLKTSFSNFRT